MKKKIDRDAQIMNYDFSDQSQIFENHEKLKLLNAKNANLQKNAERKFGD